MFSFADPAIHTPAWFGCASSLHTKDYRRLRKNGMNKTVPVVELAEDAEMILIVELSQQTINNWIPKKYRKME